MRCETKKKGRRDARQKKWRHETRDGKKWGEKTQDKTNGKT